MNRLGPRWLFRELRRRRVFNTVAIYVVGAWGALQVADLAFPGLEIPEAAIRYVWMGAFLLFPLVLVFGWLYDISTGGIMRTPPVGAASSRRCSSPNRREDAAPTTPETSGSLSVMDHWFIGFLSTAALSVIAVVLVRISGVEPDTIQAPPESSIAVMPFETCDDNTVGLQLAHQLAAEVLDQLSERGMYKVIARTSSFSLADSGWATPRISKQLGVEYVLYGEVCRDGKDLTITAELRDKNDIIKLRETYTQAINKFDQIEVRVTTLLADGLAEELGDILQPASEYPVNHLAYEQLLVSRGYASQGDFEQALSSIERALEFQSNYPEAMVWQAFYLFIRPSGEQTAARLENNARFGEQALGLVKQQLESGADSFYLRYVAGRINHELGHWNDRWIASQVTSLGEAEIAELKKTSITRFQQAERHLRSAMVLNPSGISAHIYLANTLEHLGGERRNEALEIYQRGLKIDPINADLNALLAKHSSDFGRYRQGVELLENLKGLPQVPASVWRELGWISLTHAYFVEYVELNIETLLKAPAMASGHLFHFLQLLPQLGLEEEGQDWYERLRNIPGVEASSLDDYLLRTDLQNQIIEKWSLNLIADKSNPEILEEGVFQASKAAWILAASGEYERATNLLESAWLESGFTGQWFILNSREKTAIIPMKLVELYFKTDRNDDALVLLEKTVKHLEAEYDIGIRHPQTLYFLAEAYAYQGQDEAALEMLEKAVDYHARWPVMEEKYRFYSPWERLKDNPRFIRQWGRMEADLEQQVESIRTILSRYDIDELLAPLMRDTE